MRRRQVDVPKLLKALGIEARLRGKEWAAPCPNPAHDDRHPSWRMRDDPLSRSGKHGSHKCWPCGFKGGPLDLVMKVRSLDEDEARAWLSAFYRGDAAEPPPERLRWQMGSYFAQGFELPGEVKVEPLDEWPSAAREYVESRGITAEQVERYGLGYAVYGRLAGRIVLVARDIEGAPRSYTARTFTGHLKRYLAADRSEGPDLGCMFGEQFWPPLERLQGAMRRRGWVAALEGAINGLAVERAVPELPFAVTSGTQPHPAHFAKLASFEGVLLLTDPDAAGDAAAERFAQALGRHVPVRRVRLSEGKDAQEVAPTLLREVLCRATGR